jgi:3-phenylpropionate/trans-cinnamate dioxygenase ferredoxin reductase subunit
MTDTHLIVGAGEAGLKTAETLRSLGHTGRIVLVGDEPHLPYQRPPLSKAYLMGTVGAEDLELRAPDFLAEERIELLTGVRVTALDLGDDCGEAMLSDGTTIAFAGLCLATGSRARALPVPGAELAGVLALRTLGDADALRPALDAATNVVVVGGGFVGLEVAAAARSLGRSVTVVEATERLLGRVVAPPVSDHFLAYHRSTGVDVLLDTTVTSLAGDGARVSGVVVAEGRHHGPLEFVVADHDRVLPADLVVVGIGAVPDVDLARSAGLECRRGVVVNDRARTSHPQVVAAGDCTEQPHWNLPDDLLCLESVNNAVEQGHVAAHTLLGLDPPHRGVPWFWSDQGARKLQIAGVSDGHDTHVIRGDVDGERLTVLYYRDGRLVAADAVNHPRDYMAARKVLDRGDTIDPVRAADPGIPLKELVQTLETGAPA